MINLTSKDIQGYLSFFCHCETENINLKYCGDMIGFFKDHEGIEEPQKISFSVLDKFLTYWFIRVYLDYDKNTVAEITNLVREFIKWCPSGGIDKKTGVLDDIKKELIHTMSISNKLSNSKKEIRLPQFKFSNNYWAELFKEDFAGNSDYVTSWFTLHDCAGLDALVKIRTKEIFETNGNDMRVLRSAGIKNEIIRLELYRETDKDVWRLVNIGLVYPRRAAPHILGHEARAGA